MSAAEGAPLAAPDLAAVERARRRIDGLAVRTPTLRLDGDGELWLKLESLQPIGSFKLRGAANAIQAVGEEALTEGVITASAGNMAQGVAWCARRLGVRCRVVAPDHAPTVKVHAIQALDAEVTLVPFDRWWRTLEERRHPGLAGHFLHPFADVEVMAGNATIGLEILDDVEDVETVLVPFGGGGLACGIAAAVKSIRPEVRVIACEVETAAPLTAALTAQRPIEVEYEPSFVDGIGSRRVFEPMWPLIRELIDGTLVVTLRQVRDAVRRLANERHVIAEGAGAVPVAAALAAPPGSLGRTVCVVSGGNLDPRVLVDILFGRDP